MKILYSYIFYKMLSLKVIALLVHKMLCRIMKKKKPKKTMIALPLKCLLKYSIAVANSLYFNI